MSAAALSLVAEAKRRGIALRPLEDGRIWATPRGRLTPELRAGLKEHRMEVLEVLRQAANEAHGGCGIPDQAAHCPQCGGGFLWRDGDAWRCARCDPWPPEWNGESLHLPGASAVEAMERGRQR